jgi:3-oxoacyl-[acyl-carrier-protein] synthase II
MEAFIDGRCAVSPQNSFDRETFTDNIIQYGNTRIMKCIEPPQYSKYIDPMASRRMSRIVKMSISAALKCLSEAGMTVPDAVVTGTGLGCMEDTDKFLRSLLMNKEGVLNPTPFINSTHNTIAASVAIVLKCYGYNNTFSHRGLSFESALTDSIMLLNEGTTENVLVGAADDATTDYFKITDRLGFWKKETVDNLKLLNYNSKGSIAGEGTAFFLLSKNKTDRSIARILSVGTFYQPDDPAGIQRNITTFLNDSLGTSCLPDLIILGLNGDNRTDNIYYQLKNTIFRKKPCTYFKHLCGEYDTASAFALYLSTCILKDQKVPEIIRLDNIPVKSINSVLICNYPGNSRHSMILVSS